MAMLENEVERLIDRYGVGAVLDTMATISEYKAEHVMEVWQDVGLAKAWHRAAGRLSRLAGTNDIRSVSWKGRQ